MTAPNAKLQSAFMFAQDLNTRGLQGWIQDNVIPLVLLGIAIILLWIGGRGDNAGVARRIGGWPCRGSTCSRCRTKVTRSLNGCARFLKHRARPGRSIAGTCSIERAMSYRPSATGRTPRATWIITRPGDAK